MPLTSIGDQARAFALQSASNRLKTTMLTLTEEMASGEVADLGQRLQGNTRALHEIETRLNDISQWQRNGAETAIRLQAMQDMFQAVRTSTSDLGVALASDLFPDGAGRLGTRATEIANIFEAVIQRLNGTNSNRFLMSGTASDTQPLSDRDQILDALVPLTAGMTTADQVGTAISQWFDSPEGGGGFLDQAYHGTDQGMRPVPVGTGINVETPTTAASPAVRDLLKGLAMAAILDRGALDGLPAERQDLMTAAGLALMDADTGLLGEMGRIGLNQQVVERAQVTNAAAISTLQQARGDLRRADPYETATALSEVETQLQTLYAVTARLSNLKLVDFL